MNNYLHKYPKVLQMRSLLMLFLPVIVVLMMLAAPAFASDQNSDYVLGFEDLITVTVIGHQEFSGDFFIPTEGSVDFPGVGNITVSGKTTSAVVNEITTRLKERLRDPEVYVTVKNPRSQQIHVLGAVKAPGAYAIKPGWRITEALSAAGGLEAGVQEADCTVHVLRASGAKSSVSLQEAVRGSETSNLLLQVGDVMTVEAVEMIPVYVMGKVRAPGLYRIRKDGADILAAITVAGGTLDDAALSKVTVTHLDGKSETVSLVPVTNTGKQDTATVIRSGDMVVVPESNAKFAVLGWVKNPGTYPLKENQVIRLADAIGIANGTDKRGSLGKVAILRSNGDKQERLIFNFNKFAKDGDISQNPEIRPQDVVVVPQTKGFDLDSMLSSISGSLSIFWMLDRFNSE